jgi:hypothetical protein
LQKLVLMLPTGNPAEAGRRIKSLAKRHLQPKELVLRSPEGTTSASKHPEHVWAVLAAPGLAAVFKDIIRLNVSDMEFSPGLLLVSTIPEGYLSVACCAWTWPPATTVYVIMLWAGMHPLVMDAAVGQDQATLAAVL